MSIFFKILFSKYIASYQTHSLTATFLKRILKLKRKAQLIRESPETTSNNPAYATSDEMKMASGVEVQPNSAYEAVRISRQQVQPRLDQRYPVDEVVYEVTA